MDWSQLHAGEHDDSASVRGDMPPLKMLEQGADLATRLQGESLRNLRHEMALHHLPPAF